MDWIERAKEICIDLYRDGYSLVGAIAPLVSIGFTLAKAYNLNVSLQGVSYAWALLPLVVWLAVAYIRRWLAYYQAEGSKLPNRDKWFTEAVYYLVRGRWPAPTDRLFREMDVIESTGQYYEDLRRSANYDKMEGAVQNLRQAARDGEIAVWGFLNAQAVFNSYLEPDRNAVFEEIENTHWRSYRVNPEQLQFKPEQVYTSEHGNGQLGDRSACALKVSRRQIEALAGKDQT